MLILNNRVEIDRLNDNGTLKDTVIIDFPTSVTVEASWQNFTQTCEIIVGRKLSFEGKEIALGESAILKRGQAVRVYSWYDGPSSDPNDDLIFKGVIADIIPDTPIKILCQDKMWTLKQTSVNATFKNVTLESLLKSIIPNEIFFTTTVSTTFGKIRVPNKTVMDVLKYLKKMGIFSFFVDDVLYSGTAYIPDKKAQSGAKKVRHNISVQKQVIDSDMIYRNKEDIRIKIIAFNINDDNTRFEVTVGDPDGEIRKIPFYNRSQSEVKEMAERELERYKIDGWVGSFTTFLKPKIKHGDEVELIDSNIPDRNGIYLVKKVVTTTGVNGGRQEVTLDRGI